MANKYISASAGSGKTYTITEEVKNLVQSKVEPEKIIMTTFTKVAAQDLREKTKAVLNEVGLKTEALQLEHSLIGTVHSIANTFLRKYWYLLGIMPDVKAMEESEVEIYRTNSMRELLTPKEHSFLIQYAINFQIAYSFSEHKFGVNYDFWKGDLCKVLDYMQWYNIQDFEKSIEYTKGILDCLKPDDAALTTLANQAIDEIRTLLEGMRNTPKKKTQFAVLDGFSDPLSEENLQQLKEIAADRKVGEAFLLAMTSKEMFTPERAADQDAYVRLIFDIAKRWSEKYRQYKAENHLIDFNDMEVMFLQLLKMNEVQEDIRNSYVYLFVDEFQDSNPIQVTIFQELSKLLTTTYVGDKKQAIYGFRGADTDLTTAVANSISNKMTLDCSYRSIASLVDFANKVFVPMFSPIPPQEVALNMPPSGGNTAVVDKPLRIWRWSKDEDLAKQICQFLQSEGIQPKDMAVLARNNSELDNLANELRKLNVPICREQENLNESRVGQLLKALLTLVANPSNLLARAEVAYLTSPDYNVTKVIEDRLAAIKNSTQSVDYLKDIPMIARLQNLTRYKVNESDQYSSNLLAFQSVSALVESLIIELDLYAVVHSWENPKNEENNLQEFINLAQKYEDNARKVGNPATVAGFISFFTSSNPNGAANDNGVRLFTYHKSKGLEWTAVVMLSMDLDETEDANIATRAMLGCQSHRETLPTVDELFPPMFISLVRNIYGSKGFEKKILSEALKKHKDWSVIKEKVKAESARLLYVGVTRARNILVLAPKEETNLQWFKSVGVTDIEDTETGVAINGVPFVYETSRESVDCWPEEKNRKVHQLASKVSSLNCPRYLAPSKVKRIPHEIEAINDKETRLNVRFRPEDEAKMGDFIHQVFCCADDSISEAQIKKLFVSYFSKDSSAQLPEPVGLLSSWNYLVSTLEQVYGPSVKRHHELSFRHIDENGHTLTGYIDFVWETEKGYVIVDYKTCPGSYRMIFEPRNEHYAGNHGEQLDCYERALSAQVSGKPVLARIIYYPVTQFVVNVK